MTQTRYFIVLAVLILGFNAAWMLPTAPEPPEPGLELELPFMIGDWVGQDEKVSDLERTMLGADTRFMRKSYTNGKGQHIYVSIVLAGAEMNVSIHRPEWCLPSQGYKIVESVPTPVEIEGAPMTMNRLMLHRELPLRNGGNVLEKSINYYWFTGSSETTHSHTTRNFIDIRDRFMLGYNQPWAFVMVISRIGEGLQPFGLNEQETDKVMREFLDQLMSKVQKPGVKKR